jgi:hypothetical protein
MAAALSQSFYQLFSATFTTMITTDFVTIYEESKRLVVPD